MWCFDCPTTGEAHLPSVSPAHEWVSQYTLRLVLMAVSFLFIFGTHITKAEIMNVGWTCFVSHILCNLWLSHTWSSLSVCSWSWICSELSLDTITQYCFYFIVVILNQEHHYHIAFVCKGELWCSHNFTQPSGQHVLLWKCFVFVFAFILYAIFP
jgi:hypothetical protein